MSKTLVIAEKPSVGRDLARVLPGPFKKHEGWLEGPEHDITWAVGHLVQLAEPEQYDAKFKKWKMVDLPIVPDRFKLVVRDERSKKQMAVVTKQLKRDDVDLVINACDAGREGELIFAYLSEKAGAKKPVQRLWLQSMTKEAMTSAFENLRPADDFAPLEAAARSRSEADWIVGMNSTRAATIRLRSSADGERVYGGRYHAGSQPRLKTAEEATAIVEAVRGRQGTITKLEKSTRKERAPLFYDLTSLQRDANTRFGFSARRTLAAAQRCYEEHKVLTYPRTSSRFLSGDMIGEIKPTAELVGRGGQYRRGAGDVLRAHKLPLWPRGKDKKGQKHPPN